MFILEIFHKEELIQERKMLSASSITEKMWIAINYYHQAKQEVIIRLVWLLNDKERKLIIETTEKYFENVELLRS